MKDQATIVAPAKADVEGEIQDTAKACKRLEQMEHQATTLPQERLLVGKRLVLLRRHWPARGPGAKGWGETLARLGIAQQRASELMRLAGYAESVSPADGETSEPDDREIKPDNVPSYVEAGIDKRPRKEKAKAALPSKQTAEHPPAKVEPPAVDAPTPQPVASEKHAPREQAEIVAGRDEQLVALAARVKSLSPSEKLRLAAELLDGNRAQLAHQIAEQVVFELGAALALARREGVAA